MKIFSVLVFCLVVFTCLSLYYVPIGKEVFVYRAVTSGNIPISSDFIRRDAKSVTENKKFIVYETDLFVRVHTLVPYMFWQTVEPDQWTSQGVRELIIKKKVLSEYFPNSNSRCGGVMWLCN